MKYDDVFLWMRLLSIPYVKNRDFLVFIENGFLLPLMLVCYLRGVEGVGVIRPYHGIPMPGRVWAIGGIILFVFQKLHCLSTCEK